MVADYLALPWARASTAIVLQVTWNIVVSAPEWLRPNQNGWDISDDNFINIFFSENIWISSKIYFECIPMGPIYSKLALVQVMA